MKNSIFRLLSLALALLAFGCSKNSFDYLPPDIPSNLVSAPLMSKAAGPEYIPDNYIVVFKENVNDVDGETEKLSKAYNFKSKFRYKHAVKGFAGPISAANVEVLRNDPRVAYIEQDQVMHLATTQTSPTWGLDRIDQQPLPLSTSYSYNQTGAGVDAYIIDCGILLTHSDFGGRAVTGIDEITPGGTATDGNGHGTHVAGTVGGAAYGVAKNVKLIAVRVLDNNGSGSTSGVVAGIDWVTNDHTTRPAVANMSLGGGISTALDDAVRRSIADGVTYCIAAGNSGADASTASPARVTEAVTVGATDINDGFASFSNYGSIVDISAPGVSITSDWFTSNTANNTISGTSMATPHVAGAAALYLELNPTATPAAVQTALKSNGTPNVITGIRAGTVNLLLYSTIVAGPPPAAPSAPLLSSPADASTNISTSPILSWQTTSGAASYSVQVSSFADFSILAYNQTGITSTSTTVPGLAANTKYYWRVNANNTGGTSAWSVTYGFTTAASAPPSSPAAPVLTSPSNGSTNISRSPTLTWDAAAGATSYTVEISLSAGFTTASTITSRTTASTFTNLSGLDSRVTYYWRVTANNATGTTPSSTWQFKTRTK